MLPAASSPSELGPGPVFQGRTATYWEERLHSNSPTAREEASLALRELREDGFLPLWRGLQSTAPDVRLASLQAFYKPVLLKHRSDVFPLLVGMLRDPDARICQHAAMRLAWFGGGGKPEVWFSPEGKAAIRELRRLAEYDQSNLPNPADDGEPSDPVNRPADVRKAAADALRTVEIHLSGELPPYPSAGH
jgi:hypothetical protein